MVKFFMDLVLLKMLVLKLYQILLMREKKMENLNLLLILLIELMQKM